jgi:hypothetical protein
MIVRYGLAKRGSPYNIIVACRAGTATTAAPASANGGTLTRQRLKLFSTGILWIAATVALLPSARPGAASVAVWRQELPDSLSDSAFWSIVTSFSEPGGSFESNNFTSNEINFPEIAAALADSGPHGGAYIGVGPEQNYHYIVAMRPGIAFLLDIRRQAVVQHLLFKATFELSRGRADFIAMLFSTPLPAGIDTVQGIDRIWYEFGLARGDPALFSTNLDRIRQHLMLTNGFELTPHDSAALDFVYTAFFRFGPEISYDGTSRTINFLLLTAALDKKLAPRSFLASAESFAFVKRMHERNLIIPIVADFAGPHSIRSIAQFLRSSGATARAFYVSNVESYLFRNGVWRDFYANVATLPLDSGSVFIRPYGPVGAAGSALTVVDGVIQRSGGAGSTSSGSGPLTREALCPIVPFLRAYDANRILEYSHVRQCVR